MDNHWDNKVNQQPLSIKYFILNSKDLNSINFD